MDFLKNIAGQVTHKGIFVFSKSVVISIFAVMMIAGSCFGYYAWECGILRLYKYC